MKYISSLFLLIFLSAGINAQTVVTTQPQFPTETDLITITFDVTNTNPAGKTPLINYTGDVYAHTGVYLNNNNSTWQQVIGTWGNNSAQPKMTNLGSNRYQIVINNARNFYGVTSTSQKITTLNFVLRSSDGSKQTEDIHLPLYSSGLSVVVNTPAIDRSFGDPMRAPVFVQAGGTVPISVSTAEVGATTKSIKLYVNGELKSESTGNSLSYTFAADDNRAGRNDIKVVALDMTTLKDSVQFVILKNPAVKNRPLPAGKNIGINYGSNSSEVTIALYAPRKNNVYVIGEFGNSDWKVDTSYFMNRYEPKADSVIWWTTISGLEPGKEYAYQFLVDGELRVFDPYTEKILDESNDQYIPSSVYPNLKAYPSGKTNGIVSVLQTNSLSYTWKVPQFSRPPKDKLVIYELLVRDFVSTHSYKTIIDTLSYLKRLGINAIELMPVNEFEGNDSWGYNPMTYFAPDKYYGTKNDLKTLIDSCHANGIAVIMDIVFNHAYNSNPLARLYWDTQNNRPAADNPWFNVSSPNTAFSWGNDFNHESRDTKYYIDRALSHWLNEYKVDGFRFDFSKGFTNTPGDGGGYDASRIAILKRIADRIWNSAPGAYVILEHFAANNEEIELSNYGMMIWGNTNYNYSEAAMGYITNSNFGNVSYKQRGWTAPGLIGYMESHDEERLMFKNITYGNASTGSGYSVKNMNTALSRIELAANLFIPVPGPKMIWQFGEIGYDFSINYPSLTGNDRLTAKPVRWDYYNIAERKKLFNVYASLIRLKKEHPAFSSSEFTLSASGSVKTLYITHSSMNVAIMGNFDVDAKVVQANFQNAGKWYEYYRGDSLNVTYTDMSITLQPGEYRLYTTKKISVTQDSPDESKPDSYRLEQNYPNPFNSGTMIMYQLPAAGHVTIKLYDILGREVALLADEQKEAGKYRIKLSPGALSLPSGVYFYTIQAGDFSSTKKMVLVK